MKWKNLPVVPVIVWQCILLAFLGWALETTFAAYTLYLTSRQIPMAVLFSVLTPFFSLAGQHWFVEAPTLKRRLILTGATALGYGVGTVLANLWF